ncbi:hypothetical protein [Thermobifida halotolerans]|nr:hypothetical protein [Thermobifida halotolerans]
MNHMRRMMKLATVGAMSMALIGGSASAALANDTETDVTATEAVQCVSTQEAVGAGLLIGLGLNLNLLNSSACAAQTAVNDSTEQ